MSSRTDSGQATVEAAFMIPVLFMTLLLLLQPGIILYDRMVMNHAAAEGCRLLATGAGSAGPSEARCEELVRRRLGAIPQQDLFHMHDGGCSYEIRLSGGDSSPSARVEISNEIRLLPLFDFFGTLAGFAQDGCMRIRVAQSVRTQPEWVEGSSAGVSPESWVHGRD